VLALILASGAGTVAAASEALPGEPLYGIKRTVEDIQLSVASNERKPDLLADIAEERLQETEALVEEGHVPPEVIEGVVEATHLALDALEDTSGEQHNELAEKLVSLTERQQSVLTRVIENAPPQAQGGLQRALEASRHGHQRAIQAHSGEKQTGPPDHAGPPDGDGPPGLEGKETGPPDDAGQSGRGRDDDGQESGEDEEVEEELETTTTDEPGNQGGGPKCDTPPCGQGQGQGRSNNQGQNKNQD
jgi:hypothetical protein